jgi:hypothetical protein
MRWLVFPWTLCLLAATIAFADPCLVVYPITPCAYHYDPAEYYTVGPGDPLYDPAYDRGGVVLLTNGMNDIDLSVYQAPQLTGFVADTHDQGFHFESDTFNLVIDGFANAPMTYANVLVVFDDPQPADCAPLVTVGGTPVTGGIWPAGDLVVQTPTGEGNNYSDVITLEVAWSGCYGLHVWAFSDPDYDGLRTGGECFTAFSHDSAVPVETGTWGFIKALYR